MSIVAFDASVINIRPLKLETTLSDVFRSKDKCLHVAPLPITLTCADLIRNHDLKIAIVGLAAYAMLGL